MTDQEQREQVAHIICALYPDQCPGCKRYPDQPGGKGCPDEWEDVAEKVDAIIALFEAGYSNLSISLIDVENMSHFGVIRDWKIKLKSGQEIELCAEVVEQIVEHEIIEAQGYRKMPSGEPPLLSPEEIDTCYIKWAAETHGDIAKRFGNTYSQAIAEAQHVKDMRYYGALPFG